jgi:mannose-6-phosphate isomerase-like protein (cupin superfamily)
LSIANIKSLVEEAMVSNKIIFLGKVFEDTPDWNFFYDIFKKSLEIEKAGLHAPGTLTIDNTETYTNELDGILETVKSFHPGKMITALSIIHFMNANNNDVPQAAESFYKDFLGANPNKLPPGFDFKLFQPATHTDPVDGFYIQCEGQTTWRAFYDDHTDEYLVNSGEALYVPKGVFHSVESMNVRSALSISFYDKE